jgi:hypothetical protein
MLRFVYLALVLGMQAVAAQDDPLARCAAIADAQTRLACFDTLAAGTAATPDPVARFGAENLPGRRAQESTAAYIESRLVGDFKGWDRNTQFVLENGQVWRCSDCRATYHSGVEAPAVTIRRSFTGVYWLKVEGLNQQAKVRRVE